MEKIQSTVSPKKRLGEPLDTEVTIKKEKSDEPETQIESHNELEMKQVIEMSFTDDGTKVKTSPVKEQDGKTEPGTSHKGSPSKKTPGSTEKESEEYEHARQRKEKQHEDRMKMQVLVSNFTEDQLNRYEMYRRAAFPKSSVKRLMQSITNSAVPQNVVIAMSGITKVFVGEVVEAALDTKEKWGDKGPLEPKHLREGVRQLKSKNVIPSSKYSKTLLR